MKYLLPAFFIALAISGCDAVGDPTATITGINVAVAEPDHFVEIQDVSGRAYVRVESFPASVDVQLWSAERDYFVVMIRPEDDGFQFVAASDAFKATDLTGAIFTTSGDVEADLSLE